MSKQIERLIAELAEFSQNLDAANQKFIELTPAIISALGKQMDMAALQATQDISSASGQMPAWGHSGKCQPGCTCINAPKAQQAVPVVADPSMPPGQATLGYPGKQGVVIKNITPERMPPCNCPNPMGPNGHRIHSRACDVVKFKMGESAHEASHPRDKNDFCPHGIPMKQLFRCGFCFEHAGEKSPQDKQDE